MKRLTVILGLAAALSGPNIAWAEGAKKVCVIEEPPGTIIQQIDAPNGSSAGAYCAEQVQKYLVSNPKASNASVRLSCFTQGVPDWTDGLHELRSPPCQSLR